jgi:hypothetical protein
MYSKFVWIFNSLETEIEQNETLKYSSEIICRCVSLCPMPGVQWNKCSLFFYLEFGALEIYPDLHYITFMNEKSLLSLSVVRKFIFLCYTQDCNEKYIFRLTVPHPPLHIRDWNFFLKRKLSTSKTTTTTTTTTLCFNEKDLINYIHSWK